MEKKTLIIGSGPYAVNIAKTLLSQDIKTLIAVENDGIAGLESLVNDGLEVLTNTRINACKGFIGNFDISMDVDGETITRSVSNVIIAEEEVRVPNFSVYGLTPSTDVISLSEMMAEKDAHGKLSAAKKIVFLAGLNNEGNHVVTEDIMRTCLGLQTDSNIKTYILTGNLKVAGNGLERLYRLTREAGTVYFKFSEAIPNIQQGNDGKVGISFLDEITREKFRLMPDITVVDETISPSDYLEGPAKVFGIDTDKAGFAQTDNIHRLSVSTNRKGIFVAGPSRSIQCGSGHKIDAANAVLTVLGPSPSIDDNEATRAEIDKSGCVRCLTCLRICPYKAVILNTRPSVVTEACEGCGICAAECPKSTINMQGPAGSDILSRINEIETGGNNKKFVPLIIAFCCARSAAGAWELASDMDVQLPKGLRVIKVPCTGSVSFNHIFTAFKSKADGVMVLTCHDGNCHSEHGNIRAEKRVNRIAERMDEMGFEKKRLMKESMASNMGGEFAGLTKDFEKIIQELGPSRIKG